MKELSKSKKIGELIRLIRLEKNLSQEALAIEFNLSVSTLSNLERGTTEFTISRLYCFLEFFEINIIDFFTRIEKSKVNKNNDFSSNSHSDSHSKQLNLEEEIRLIKKEIQNLKTK